MTRKSSNLALAPEAPEARVPYISPNQAAAMVGNDAPEPPAGGVPEIETRSFLPERVPGPVSRRQHFLQQAERARAEKEALLARAPEILAQARATRDELDRVQAGISGAEYKLQRINTPRSVTPDARALAIAAGLMGAEVDLQALPRAEDFGASLTSGDLQSGLSALIAKREELTRRVRMQQSEAKNLQSAYYTAHAEEHAAEFMVLRDELANHYIQIEAAQRSNLGLTNMSFLTGPHFATFHIPAADDALESIRQHKNVGSQPITTDNINSSRAITTAQEQLAASFR